VVFLRKQGLANGTQIWQTAHRFGKFKRQSFCQTGRADNFLHGQKKFGEIDTRK